jgi:hypothetical protein
MRHEIIRRGSDILEHDMQVSKWRESLAIRLVISAVEALQLNAAAARHSEPLASRAASVRSHDSEIFTSCYLLTGSSIATRPTLGKRSAEREGRIADNGIR